MYISDTEDFLAAENDICNESEVENQISSSSDEAMEENAASGTV